MRSSPSKREHAERAVPCQSSQSKQKIPAKLSHGLSHHEGQAVHNGEQIIGFLKAHESGAKVANLVREHGLSEQSCYRFEWFWETMLFSMAIC